MPQLSFRLFHAARDARITGKVERDHGNVGMYPLRPEQNGFRLPNAFGASKRIGEADSPTCGSGINLYQMAGNCCGHSHFFAAI